MVDDKDNHVDQSEVKAWELPILLLGAFRSLIDEAHTVLAREGHPGTRPVHGFALQAVGEGATAGQVAERLGVSKQAAARTIAMLEAQGYVERAVDPADSRRKIVQRTERGTAFLDASARAFGEVLDGWAGRVRRTDLEHLHRTLRELGVGAGGVLDLGSWAS